MSRPIPYGVADGTPALFDRLELNDIPVPGLAIVTPERSNKKDEKKAKGTNGANVEYSGADLAKVKIEIRYITAEDDDEFTSKILPIIEPNPDKKKVEAVKISSGYTSRRGINAITVDKVVGPLISGGYCRWQVDATESRPPTTKNATGKFAGGPKKGSNCAELAKLYSDLIAETNRLRGELAVLKATPPTLETPGWDPSFTAATVAGLVTDQVNEYYSEIAFLENQIAVSEANKAGTYAAMVAQNCVNSPPSGNKATTEPDPPPSLPA